MKDVSTFNACSRKEGAVPDEETKQILLTALAEYEPLSVRRGTPSENRRGGDYVVCCRRGVRYVDCKIRSEDPRNYGRDDVIVEIMSNAELGNPGWGVDSGRITTDFCWIWRDTRRVLVIPAAGLWEALRLNLEAWKARFGVRENRTACRGTKGYYTSLSVPVPVAVLERTIEALGFTDSGQGQ